jgi:hypothetical protein
MNKYLTLGVFVALGIVSCKKEYKCECVKVVLSSGEQTSTEHVFESRKSSAQKKCNEYKITNEDTSLSSFEPFETTCSLR